MADVYSSCGCGNSGGGSPSVRVVAGNDLTVEALVSVYDRDEGVYKPLDLSDATDVSLKLVGTFSKVSGQDVAASGARVSAFFPSGTLGTGSYGVEITFTDKNGKGRAFERNLIGVVATSGEATVESTAEGETGEGLNVTVDIVTRTVRIGGSGTSDYSQLDNKPSINGVELVGDRSGSELGLVGSRTVAAVVTMTESEYAALEEKDPATLYVITKDKEEAGDET